MIYDIYIILSDIKNQIFDWLQLIITTIIMLIIIIGFYFFLTTKTDDDELSSLEKKSDEYEKKSIIFDSDESLINLKIKTILDHYDKLS